MSTKIFANDQTVDNSKTFEIHQELSKILHKPEISDK